MPAELQGHEDCKLRIKDCAICTAKHNLYFEAVREADERARKVLGPERYNAVIGDDKAPGYWWGRFQLFRLRKLLWKVKRALC